MKVFPNLMNLPITNYNAKTFPQLGAFPGEIGSGLSPGGIGGVWYQGMPPTVYTLGYGSKKTHKGSKNKRKNKRRYNKKMSKKCKTLLSRKIAHNIREFKSQRGSKKNKKIKSIKQAIAMAYNQVKCARK